MPSAELHEMSLTGFSPKSPEISEKSKKYDRQIRLWGDHGQSMLESAHVCLINGTCLGTEILKGLVLPGIGAFTVVDSHMVTEEDVGVNFFLENSSVGQSRAKCTVSLLRELNPDVNGDAVDEVAVEKLLETNLEFFKSFDLVIGTALSEKQIVQLSNKMWELNIPFLVCRSVGFLATCRLQVKEHCVVETHPDNEQSDLRLEHPFKSLQEHIAGLEITPKVPWLIVLYKYLDEWRAKNDMHFPKNYKEKSSLKELIRSGMSTDEENFEEAIKAVNSSFGGGRPSAAVQEIFSDSCCKNLEKSSKPFWIMARSVKDFVENEGNGWLPLPGILPDMTAETAFYINLQNIYRAQAMADADSVYRRVQQHLHDLSLPSEMISEKAVRLFCRESAHLSVFRGSKVADEYGAGYVAKEVASSIEDPTSLIANYVVLRAMERFQSEFGYLPGECEVEADTARIKSLVGKLLHDWGIAAPVTDELAHEICRYGGAEIHSISSFMGGCVAHEAIKLITKQYKPMNNTFIYDAVNAQQTATFEM